MRQWIKTSGFAFVFLLFLPVSVNADTFRHKESGDIFTGFATQMVTGGRTRVYNSEQSKMMPVTLSDYEITYDSKGRRDNVSLVIIDQPEILLSETVAKKAADTIINAANKGPQAIIIQIDGPGGQGNAMKIVADAISQTDNCPVIAYISKGAYSAMAVVAQTCDKIYLKSTAEIGTVGSVEGGSDDEQNYGLYLSIYNSDSLLNYSTYVTALAQKHKRPELLMKALIDKRISIIEVADIDGSQKLVEDDKRQPTQTLLRTFCEGVQDVDSESVSPADIIGKVLHLTAKDAIELGLADKTAESVNEILADMQLSEAKIRPAPGIEATLKKYTAARRNIADGLFRIDQYERDIDILRDQFTSIDKQLRTGTQTRAIRQGEVGYRPGRSRERLPSGYDYYGRTTGSGRIRSSDRDRRPRSQVIITEEPNVHIGIVYGQLTAALEGVVSEYRRVLNLVRRWPGGLPPKMSKTMLEENMNSARTELDSLYRYQGVYPAQFQNQAPRRTPRNRRR
ncbi:MAG: hypothetical protein ABFR90_01990 [Planctomycetota bacterium]